MATTIESKPLKQTHPIHGEYETPALFDYVMRNGKQIGWRPSDKSDPNHKVLHPLSGVPQQVAEAAVKECGELDSTLRAPKPSGDAPSKAKSKE